MPDDLRLPEMAFSRDLVKVKITGREETINEHLVKLLAFDVAPDLRAAWKRELVRKHLDVIARMRVKPHRRPLPAATLLEWLYLGPFEGNEVGYTEALVRLHDDTYPRNGLNLPEVAARLDALHRALAPALAGARTGPH